MLTVIPGILAVDVDGGAASVTVVAPVTAVLVSAK